MVRPSSSAGGAARAAVTSLFERTFAARPAIVASAPGRVNLIGEHTDYSGGEVLPIGIEQRTWVAVGAGRPADPARAVSDTESDAGEWNAAHPAAAERWWDYVSGVAWALARRGITLPPLQVAVSSDVPAGGGLSSSAALEVAAATAISRLAGAELAPRDAALLAHEVETEYVGVACGIMDQFASALARGGEALHLWCDSGRTEGVPLADTVLIFDTAVPRSLRTSAFNQRRAECEQALRLLRRDDKSLPTLAAAPPEQVLGAGLPPVLERRALHVSQETRRVQAAVEALQRSGTLPGPLLYESHESLRDLYECSSPELDWFVDRCRTLDGIRGARLTGAGWGGCAIAVGDPAALPAASGQLAAEYHTRFGRHPRTWLTAAEEGVRVEPER